MLLFFFLFLFILLLPDWVRVACALPTFQPTATQFSKGEPGGGYRPTPHRFAVFFSLSLSLSLSLSELILAHQLQFYFSLHPFSVCVSLSFCLRCNRGGGPLSTVSFLASTPTVTRVTSVYTSETKRSQTDTEKKRKQKRRKKKRQTETFFPRRFPISARSRRNNRFQ